MRLDYTFKNKAKTARWHMRRFAAARKYGRQALEAAPIVLGNAIPKAGSHLINQVLQGLPQIGPFVQAGFFPVNRGEDNSKLPQAAVLANIQRMRPGDIGYGYLHCEEPFLSALTGPGRATIFVYRDPRDVALSAMKYAAYMNKKHGLHEYMRTRVQSDEERLNAIIQGIPEPGIDYSSIQTRFAHYLGWLDQPDVLCLRFEDLIQDREAAFGRLLDYLAGIGFTPAISREQAAAALHASIRPERSGTFRKGKPGGWKQAYTEANKTAFKQTTGDLLVRLGYEEDENW